MAATVITVRKRFPVHFLGEIYRRWIHTRPWERPDSTGNELQEDAYAECIGVDVSLVAIGKGGARDERNRRRGKNRYVCADILTYVPPHK